MKWVALFSQTGSEILEVSKKLGRSPDKIITNNQDLENINKELVDTHTIYYVDRVPAVQDYFKLIPEGTLTTLHGWLRIVPEEVCDKRRIINGHPGDIVTYPELKGKDPQERAFNSEHKTGGCVIHEVVAEVDAGKIISNEQINIDGLSLDEVYHRLHDLSVKLWVEYLKKELYE